MLLIENGINVIDTKTRGNSNDLSIIVDDIKLDNNNNNRVKKVPKRKAKLKAVLI